MIQFINVSMGCKKKKNTIRWCFTVVLSFIAGTTPEDYGNINWWLCAAGHYWLLSLFCTSYCSECFKAPTFVFVRAVGASQSVKINLPFFFLLTSHFFHLFSALRISSCVHVWSFWLLISLSKSYSKLQKKSRKNTHAKAAINQRGSKGAGDKDATIIFLWSQNSSPFLGFWYCKARQQKMQLCHMYLWTV